MLIVAPSPSIDFDLGIFQRLKSVSVQVFVSEATIEALDHSIVGQFAGATELDLHAVGVCPTDQFVR